MICVLSFRFTRQSRQVILEANEAKKWEIRDVFNVLYGNDTYPLELLWKAAFHQTVFFLLRRVHIFPEPYTNANTRHIHLK